MVGLSSTSLYQLVMSPARQAIREAVFVVVGVGHNDPHIPSAGRGAPTGTYTPYILYNDEGW